MDFMDPRFGDELLGVMDHTDAVSPVFLGHGSFTR